MASRPLWISLILATILVWIVVLILLLNRVYLPASQTLLLPTLAAFPSLTPTQTATDMPTVSETPIPTRTTASTHTVSPPSTATLSSTPTLSVRLLEATVVMSDVHLEATGTAFPFGTNLLPAPPNPIEPLPDATHQVPPFVGWYSFESDYPTVQYQPIHWTARQVVEASEGQYHRYEGFGTATFVFEGEGLRLRYVAARNMGIFEIVVDGQIIDTIDAYRPERVFPGTDVYLVGSGQHILEIRNTGQRNNRSEGITVGLDAIQVYRAEENTLIIPPPVESNTPSPSPQAVRNITLIQTPFVILPTTTAPAPIDISASVIIAYDENGNRDVDPAEGVFGIPVRMVAADTNRMIAQALTDEQGFAQMLVTTSGDMRLVVPYFGEVWTIQHSASARNHHFTLLLEPGNQPGIIP